jgi:hypothetical protein
MAERTTQSLIRYRTLHSTPSEGRRNKIPSGCRHFGEKAVSRPHVVSLLWPELES